LGGAGFDDDLAGVAARFLEPEGVRDFGQRERETCHLVDLPLRSTRRWHGTDLLHQPEEIGLTALADDLPVDHEIKVHGLDGDPPSGRLYSEERAFVCATHRVPRGDLLTLDD
jgi:hypothetical protein